MNTGISAIALTLSLTHGAEEKRTIAQQAPALLGMQYSDAGDGMVYAPAESRTANCPAYDI